MTIRIRYKILGEEKNDKSIIRTVSIKAKSTKEAKKILSKRIHTQNKSGRVVSIRRSRR